MMNAKVEELLTKHGLHYCVECGKCGSVCPMRELFPKFSHERSARRIIEKVLQGADLDSDPSIWFCLGCNSCEDLCPAGVHFSDFLQDVRNAALAEGKGRKGIFCTCCGRYFLPRAVAKMLQEKLPDHLHWVLRVCPSCRRHDQGAKIKALLPLSKKASKF